MARIRLKSYEFRREREATWRRLEDLEASITEVDREYADLEEIWKAEKASLRGAQDLKEDLDSARGEFETARRAGDLARMSELQYGTIPELEKQLAAASDDGAGEPRQLLRNSVTEEEGRGSFQVDGHPDIEIARGRA